MVGTRRFGRLGNELYQYAAVIGYAIKHGLEWSLPRVTNDAIWNPTHFAHLYNPNWIEGKEDVLINEIWNLEQQYQEIEFREEWRDKQIVLNGYWQSYKYYDFCMDEVLRVFDFPYEIIKDFCSIHVRRGDYLLHPTKHPVVTVDYLYKAIEYIVTQTEGRIAFYVFSDDIDWCKRELWHLSGVYSFLFSEGKSEIDDLILMSNCEHNIISNSTMAMWGAELNRNPNKIVVTPSEQNWFGWENKLTVKDLIRPEYIQIRY